MSHALDLAVVDLVRDVEDRVAGARGTVVDAHDAEYAEVEFAAPGDERGQPDLSVLPWDALRMVSRPGIEELGDLPESTPLVAAHGAGDVHLAPPASEEHVSAFEHEHGVALPESYRRLILELGNGGDGPPFYGLEPLSDHRIEPGGPHPAENHNTRLATRFPGVPCEGLEDMLPEEADREWARYEAGRLLLGTDGCAILFVLVLTGPARGQVWRIDEVGAVPEADDVLRWYAAWLRNGGVHEYPDLDRPLPRVLREPRPGAVGKMGGPAGALAGAIALAKRLRGPARPG